MSGALKEVRERISSVNSTMKITKAMKMVSAAKLRKAQQAITEMRPYANRLNKMLVNILSNLEGDTSSSFGVKRDVNRVAIAIVTSNKGLCGAFNTNIGKAASTLLEKYDSLLQEGNVDLIFVGKKGYEYIKNKAQNANLNHDYTNLISDLSFENVSQASQFLMDKFADGTYDKVYACYGSFKNAAVQFAIADQFLPVSNKEIVKDEDKEHLSNHKADYTFEPSKVELLEELIPSILHTTFRKYLLDTNASEHGARMTAMDKATENAGDLLKELKINYNKARQASITNEILEIVSGAAALDS